MLYEVITHETHTCLRERGFGIMEGLYREEIQQKYPETYQAYMQRDVNCPIPGGESLTQFYNRVITGVNELTDRYSGEQLLVVTHGGVLDCMIRMIFKYPLDAPRCFTLYNASINTFTRANGQWKLTSWGMVGHQNSATASIDEPGR